MRKKLSCRFSPGFTSIIQVFHIEQLNTVRVIVKSMQSQVNTHGKYDMVKKYFYHAYIYVTAHLLYVEVLIQG